MRISHLSERNWPKYFTLLTNKLALDQPLGSFFDVLKIRVSVVRFRPWPPLTH